MFNDLKIGAKIGLGFGVVLILLGVVAYSAYSGFLGVEDRYVKADDVNRLVIQMHEIEHEQQNLTLTDDPQHADNIMVILNNMRNQAKETRSKHTKEEDIVVMDKLLATADVYEEAFQGYNDLAMKEEKQKADMIEKAHDLENVARELRKNQKAEYVQLRAEKGKEALLDKKLNIADDSFEVINLMLQNRRREKDYMLREQEKYYYEVVETSNNLISLATDIKGRLEKEESRNLADMIIVNAQRYLSAFETYKELYDEHEIKLGEMNKAASTVIDICSEARTIQNTKTLKEIKSKKSLILGSAGLAILLGLIISFVIIRSITSPVARIMEAAQEIAEGDLTRELEIVQKDEIGQLADAFRKMKERMQEQARELKNGVNVLATSSGQIVTTIAQLATSANQTSSSANETTTTVEEARQTALVANEKAKSVSETAQNAVQVSTTGRKATEDTVEGMNRVREQVELVAENIVTLSEQGQAIGEIIVAVDDLAEQTNILAVNASIEAVKAGEHGKGFSVVAQEVKSLAGQSKQATKRVRTILNDIQRATGRAVMVTEEAGKTVDAGVKQAGQAGEAITTLAESINEAAQAGTQIAASSRQQLTGMEQVTSAMESIKDASAQNASGIKQLETAAKNLSGLGDNLKKLVTWYKFEA